MNLPPRAFEIVNIMYNANIGMATSGGDDDRRHLTRMMVEQIAYELGPVWGCKARDSRAPQSADTIAFKINDFTMDLWDWQNGTTLAPQLLPNQLPTYPNYTGAYFITVDPINHLNVGAPPVVIPPNPNPTYNFSDLIKAVGELNGNIIKLQADSQAQTEALATQIEAMKSIGRILQVLVDKPNVATVEFPNYVATAFGAKIVLKPAV